MKKLLLLALVMTLSITMSVARDKKVDNVKTTTFVADIHCENCSIKVMNNVPALGKGIKDVAVDVAQKTITVTYDATKNNDDNIVKGLKSLNVNAKPTSRAATPRADARKKMNVLTSLSNNSQHVSPLP